MRLFIEGEVQDAKEKDVCVSLRMLAGDVQVFVHELGCCNKTHLLTIEKAGRIYIWCSRPSELRALGFKTKGNGEVEQY